MKLNFLILKNKGGSNQTNTKDEQKKVQLF